MFVLANSYLRLARPYSGILAILLAQGKGPCRLRERQIAGEVRARPCYEARYTNSGIRPRDQRADPAEVTEL